MNAVTIEVYAVRGRIRRKRAGASRFRLIWLGEIVFPQATSLPLQELAAQAWCRCVGEPRRVLLEAMNAPANLVQQETDWRHVAAQLQIAPSVFCELGGFFLDNRCEAWLLAVSESTPPRITLQAKPPRGIHRGWQNPSWN